MPSPTRDQYAAQLHLLFEEHMPLLAASPSDVTVLGQRLVNDDVNNIHRTAGTTNQWLSDIGAGSWCNNESRIALTTALRTWRRQVREGEIDLNTPAVSSRNPAVGDRIRVTRAFGQGPDEVNFYHSFQVGDLCTVETIRPEPGWAGGETAAVYARRDRDQHGQYLPDEAFEYVSPVVEVDRPLAVGDAVEIHGYSETWNGPGTITRVPSLFGDTYSVRVEHGHYADTVAAFDPRHVRRRTAATGPLRAGEVVECHAGDREPGRWDGPVEILSVPSHLDMYYRVRTTADHPMGPGMDGGFSDRRLRRYPVDVPLAVGDRVEIHGYSARWNGPAVVESVPTDVIDYYTVRATSVHPTRPNSTGAFNAEHLRRVGGPVPAYTSDFPVGTVIESTYGGEFYQRTEMTERGWKHLNSNRTSLYEIPDRSVRNDYQVVEGARLDAVLNPPFARGDLAVLTRDYYSWTEGQVVRVASQPSLGGGDMYCQQVNTDGRRGDRSAFLPCMTLTYEMVRKTDAATKYPVGTVIRHRDSGSVYTRVAVNDQGCFWRHEAGGMFGGPDLSLPDALIAAHYDEVGVDGACVVEETAVLA